MLHASNDVHVSVRHASMLLISAHAYVLQSYTEHTWTAMVQLRQKVKHKKTMFYLEQLLLKHGVVERAM